jgi:hypothetical protein
LREPRLGSGDFDLLGESGNLGVVYQLAVEDRE